MYHSSILPQDIVEEAIAIAMPFNAVLDRKVLAAGLVSASNMGLVVGYMTDVIALGAYTLDATVGNPYDRAIATILTADGLPPDLFTKVFPGANRDGLKDAIAALAMKVEAVAPEAIPENCGDPDCPVHGSKQDPNGAELSNSEAAGEGPLLG